MSLTTPEKIRSLQRKLYLKAKHFLRRRHKIKSGGTRLLPAGKSLRGWGVVRLLEVMFSRRHACALR